MSRTASFQDAYITGADGYSKDGDTWHVWACGPATGHIASTGALVPAIRN